jgi:hypothetical protein
MCFEREEAREMVGNHFFALHFQSIFLCETAGGLITCHFRVMPVIIPNRFSIIKE